MAEPMFHPQLMDYLDGLVPARDEVMAEMEAYAREVRFPIIGTAAGYYNYILARITGATQVFELGSGFGYSTAWFDFGHWPHWLRQNHHAVRFIAKFGCCR